MRHKTKKVSDRPMGKLMAVTDFLPPPEKLVPVGATVKVTLALDKGSLDFFKAMARKIGAKYQRMMREVLSGYAHHYAGRRS